MKLETKASHDKMFFYWTKTFKIKGVLLNLGEAIKSTVIRADGTLVELKDWKKFFDDFWLQISLNQNTFEEIEPLQEMIVSDWS